MSEKIVIHPEEVVRHRPNRKESGLLRSKEIWLVGSATVVVLSVVTIGTVLVVSQNSTSDSRISPDGNGHLTRQSIATLEYWDQLRQIRDSLDNDDAFTETKSAEEYVEQLQRQRKAIDSAIEETTRLATLDVDQDAIEVGAKMAELLTGYDALLVSFERLMSDAEAFDARATSAELMVESFIRGFFGDPFAITDEMRAEQGELSDRHRQILQQEELLQTKANELRIFGSRVRAKLAARYGIEFPPLD